MIFFIITETFSFVSLCSKGYCCCCHQLECLGSLGSSLVGLFSISYVWLSLCNALFQHRNKIEISKLSWNQIQSRHLKTLFVYENLDHMLLWPIHYKLVYRSSLYYTITVQDLPPPSTHKTVQFCTHDLTPPAKEVMETTSSNLKLTFNIDFDKYVS